MNSAFIIIGFIVVFIGAIIVVIFTSQREQQRRIQRAQELGFTPVEPDQTLVDKITAIHPNYADGSRNRLHNVMRRSIPYGTMYLYDLTHTGRKSTSAVESGAIAIIAPDLNLPPFNVFPRLSTGGALADLANQFMESMLTMQGLDEISFPDIPELDQKFFITGENEEEIQSVFTPSLADLALKKPLFTMLARGDIISFGRTNLSSAKQDTTALQDLMNHALAVFDCITRLN